MRVALLAALLTLGLAAPAGAQPAQTPPAQIVTRDVPVAGARAFAVAEPTPRFNLVGIHWQGSGTVSFRARALSGMWSPWRPAAPEDEDRPDDSSAERTVESWEIGNPYWTGPSDAIEYRLHGRVQRLRAHFVWSPADPEPPRAPAIANAPPVIPRAAWGANELIRRAPPSYAQQVRFAVVHHTAGTNNYTRAQSAAIVRGIQLYHVRGNGWHDIGYNFLVDKFGQVFEGRFGGLERNVIGAHAAGFNTGSAGVALLGNYTGTAMSAAARDALVRVLAWRLDVAHADPLSTFNWTSRGNSRFPAGRSVPLRTIVGHRDTGFTACPGDLVYRALDDLARRVSQTGLPKLYEPVVSGRLGGPIRFTARLSSALPWTVTVVNAAGERVASGSGSGAAVDWTWDSSAAPPGAYSYAFAAGERVRPAAGTLGTRAATLSLTAVRAEPAAITPSSEKDGSATVSYTLGAPALVTATLVRADGTVLATLFSEQRPPGANSFAFSAAEVPDGIYRIVLRAADGNGREVAAEATVLVSRTLASFSLPRALFSPNGDGRLDTLPIRFTLTAPADVRLRILTKDDKWVATPLLERLQPGVHVHAWDGSKRIGRLLDGEYRVEISVTDIIGTFTQKTSFVSDTRPPRLQLLSLRPLRFRLDEPADVVVVVNGQRRVVRRTAPGVFVVPSPAVLRTLRANAWDAAGNVSRPVTWRR
jgi:hypothetical protein